MLRIYNFNTKIYKQKSSNPIPKKLFSFLIISKIRSIYYIFYTLQVSTLNYTNTTL